MVRYIVAVLALIAVIIIAGVLVFGGRGGPDQVPRQIMQEYAEGSGRLVYNMRGRILGEEDFRTIRITVTRDQRVLEVLQGYNETALTRQTYNNNGNAYEAFVRALDRAGFASRRSATIEDDRGACPTGRLFSYQLYDAANPEAEAEVWLWGSSCSRRDGTFNGNAIQVRNLFQGQIPDYRDHVRGVRL